ncbi:uncharacterized protein METZ01_LOCUS384327, partial [marine metagenome]
GVGGLWVISPYCQIDHFEMKSRSWIWDSKSNDMGVFGCPPPLAVPPGRGEEQKAPDQLRKVVSPVYIRRIGKRKRTTEAVLYPKKGEIK